MARPGLLSHAVKRTSTLTQDEKIEITKKLGRLKSDLAELDEKL